MNFTSDFEQELLRYADLVITMGISLNRGQSVYIKTGPGTYYFARLLARQAYKHSAEYVHIETEDNQVLMSRLENLSTPDSISFPKFRSSMLSEMLDDDWAYIRIEETDDTEVLQDADMDSLKAYTSALNTLQQDFKNSLMNSEHPWCVICAPSGGWARQVLGKHGSAGDLWDILKPILRLDRHDPAVAWREHGNKLIRRCSTLDALKLDTLHILDEGTDLTIGLTRHAQWVGGPDTRRDGRIFFANLPTEEVFTVPHKDRTQGSVSLTMPVSIMDTIVEGARLTFKDGKVVSFDADKNAQVLEKFLSLDDGTGYLGEIALVDTSSPIYQSGKVFYSVLFDENAACHIALGQGYSGCLSVDPPALSKKDKRKYHCNVSMMHADVMISSNRTCITGRSLDGRVQEIMREGKLLV